MSSTLDQLSGYWRGLLFRFLLIYLVLFILPFPFSFIPYAGSVLSAWYNNLWRLPVSWTAIHLGVLKDGFQSIPNGHGSGDTTYDYLRILVMLAFSIQSAIILSMVAKGKYNYSFHFLWLTILVRLYLGMNGLFYGFAKLFKTQFPDLSTRTLLESVGNQSPMHLLWTFMGYSIPYTFFIGLGETLGGLLLFFRRTTLLGAIILFTILLNILMINLSYDVPVKLFSLHLFIMVVVLLAPDVKRLWKFFAMNETVEPGNFPELFNSRVKRITFDILKIVLLFAIIFYQVHLNVSLNREEGRSHNAIERPIYIVDKFILRGDSNTTDKVRWSRIFVENSARAVVEYCDGSEMVLRFQKDTTDNTVMLGSKDAFTFTCRSIDDTHQWWLGLIGADSLKLLVNKTLPAFPLTQRGFHWINEEPFNK